MSVSSGGSHKPRCGGHVLGVPQMITTWRVTGPVLVGHTADFHDQDAPIIIREADDVHSGPDGTGYAEGRCRSCIARPYLARREDESIMILQHEPGCPEMAYLLRLAGARS